MAINPVLAALLALSHRQKLIPLIIPYKSCNLKKFPSIFGITRTSYQKKSPPKFLRKFPKNSKLNPEPQN